LNDAFVVKYDAAGQVSWARSAGGVDNDYGDGIAIDASGSPYVTGRFQHSAYFSGINISNFNSGVSDVFVAKYAGTGSAVWVKQAGETGMDRGVKIGVTPSGTCFVTGTYDFEINFDQFALTGTANKSYVASIGSTYQTSIGNAILIAGTKICGGNVLKIEYPVTGVFNAGNTFTAQLSDASGDFTSPTNIGSVSTALNNTIYAVIPDVATGTGYHIRVISSNPGLTGPDNGIDLSINLGACDSVTPALESFPIVAGEYFFDTDPGIGNGQAISVTQGDSVSLSLSISAAGLSAGFHNLFVRFKDSRNVWSLYDGRIIYIQPEIEEETVLSSIVSGEYFFDTDPGVGNGTPLAAFTEADSISITSQISVAGLTEGFHNLFIRMKDTANVWSLYEGRIINIQADVEETVVSSIVSGEYFFNTDPGVGNGIPLPSFTQADSISITSQVSAAGLPFGFNNLFIRVKDTAGVWSLYEGRKFFICSDVLATPVISGNTAVCSGSGLNLSGSTVTGAISYLWTGPGGFSQAGTDLTRTNMNASIAGAYTFYAIRAGGTKCDSSLITVNVTVNPVYTVNNPQVICQGGSYAINGNSYATAGTYKDTLVSVNGCDSIIVTQLTVNPVYQTDNIQDICDGESYTINGNTYTADGTYTDVMQSVNGCDSTVVTYLTIHPLQTVNNPQMICTGGSYTINGNTYTADGTYTDVLQSIYGCDSTVITQLSVVTSFNINNPVTICQGESYTVGANTYTTAGTYNDLLVSALGCDSMVTTVLTVNAVFAVNNPQTICQGDSYTIGANTYTSNGTYTDVLQSVNGCDSTVTTVLTVIPLQTVNNPQQICTGGSYTIAGNTYTTAGTYTDILQSVDGCDSTVITQLTVNPVHTVNNPQTICAGESYTVGANTYSIAGTYVDVLQSVGGCDSTVTTVLTVNPVSSATNPQTICSGESYQIGGNTYTTAGTYTDILQAVNGCDSTVTTILTVNVSPVVNNPQVICQGESYTIGSSTYTIAGTYNDVFQAVNGCDSTIVTQLTVNPVYAVNNPQTICLGESYTINGNVYTTAGNYTDVLQSVQGCDSVVTTQLTVNNPVLDLTVTEAGSMLTAVESNATYQWIDCGNGNAEINGETSQSFTSTVNGEFAVVLTTLQCDVSDTSLCITIDNVGIAQIESVMGISVYPNPAQDKITIETGGAPGEVFIFNAEGKQVYSRKMLTAEMTVDVSKWSKGLYVVEVYSGDGIARRKIIKE
ncbi:MAG: hypothetical protein K0R65_800, partial [Crocinitomicaceae bacterium]|nr:hypothetical protein [Crocinitomicaceae bacterium]